MNELITFVPLTSTDSGYFPRGPISVFDLVGAFQEQTKGIDFYEFQLFVQESKIWFCREEYSPLTREELVEDFSECQVISFPENTLPDRLEKFLHKIRVAFPGRSFQELMVFISKFDGTLFVEVI